jgi:hypothetical protein
MKKVLLDETLNFYKGNMHCHSTLSDGRFTPERLKEIYKAKGYSFLAITDHEHINNNSHLDDEEFITITSGEFAIKQFPRESTLKNYDMKVCHLNLYAKEQSNDYAFCYNSVADHFSDPARHAEINKPDTDYEREYGHAGISRIIKDANEHGFFVCYNHPRWSLENYGDYSGYDGLWGVEIYNHGCAVDGLYDYDINVLDDMLRDGKRVFASSGDDNHNRGDDPLSYSFGAAVYVNAESLSYESIISGLLEGRFYTTMAPTIHSLYIEDGRVYVKCSNAAQITYSTRGRRVKAVRSDNADLTEASFEIRETDGYFRIDVIDANGKRANTQAYFLERK